MSFLSFSGLTRSGLLKPRKLEKTEQLEPVEAARLEKTEETRENKENSRKPRKLESAEAARARSVPLGRSNWPHEPARRRLEPVTKSRAKKLCTNAVLGSRLALNTWLSSSMLRAWICSGLSSMLSTRKQNVISYTNPEVKL